MEASLVMFKADGERKDFPLVRDSMIVGRKNTCDLRIPLSSVSRQHFRVDKENGRLMLRDLGSSNGTFYNGDRVLEVPLAAGGQIRVGPVTFVVVIDGQPADIEPIKTVLPSDSPADAAHQTEFQAPSAPVEIQAKPRKPDVDIDEENQEAAMAAMEALNAPDPDSDESEASGAIMLDDEDENESSGPTRKTKT